MDCVPTICISYKMCIRDRSNYNKRYRYSGNFNASYLVTKTGEKNMPDYMVTKDFRIAWSKRQDAKASPNSSFSANVNFATSSYDPVSYTHLVVRVVWVSLPCFICLWDLSLRIKALFG